MYLTRGGGYYFNVGCSDLIAEGKIALAQFSDLEGLLKEADLAVLATGWKGQEHLVRKLFGEEIAAPGLRRIPRSGRRGPRSPRRRACAPGAPGPSSRWRERRDRLPSANLRDRKTAPERSCLRR